MSVIRTDVRDTLESAERIRFDPTGAITATNVQDAIEEVATSPVSVSPTNVTTTPYPVQVTDTVLYVDTSGGPITIELPSASLRGGVPLEVKDISGDANTNNITITPDGAETIDDQATWPVDINFGGIRLYPIAGTGWTQAP